MIRVKQLIEDARTYLYISKEFIKTVMWPEFKSSAAKRLREWADDMDPDKEDNSQEV